MEKLTFLMIILALFVLLSMQPSEAQKNFSSPDKRILRTEDLGACLKSSPLGLTEEQGTALESLQHACMAEAAPLWNKLRTLRIELKYLVKDPNIQPKILLDRQKKISELQARLDNLSLSYQIKARSIFTKEQLEQLPQDCLLGMGTGFGMGIGIGRGPRKGPR